MVASSTTDLISALVPFALLVLFWLFLTRRVKASQAAQNPVVDKLEEIREELHRLRRAVEERGSF